MICQCLVKDGDAQVIGKLCSTLQCYKVTNLQALLYVDILYQVSLCVEPVIPLQAAIAIEIMSPIAIELLEQYQQFKLIEYIILLD